MEEIKRQVARARRRMNLNEFLRLVTWSLTVTLAVALIGLAIPRVWVLELNADVWNWSWIGGAIGLGLMTGLIVAYVRRRGDLDAAIEIDRRYGLRERVASSMSLAPDERESVFGQALMNDAARRVERIDVREHFKFAYNWRMLLPLLPAAGMFALILLVPPAEKKVTAAPGPSEETKQRIKKASAELEKKLAKAQEQMKKEGLKDAAEALKEVEKANEKIKNGDADDRKDALVKLNDMIKELQKKRDELGSSEQLKKDLKQELKDLKDLDKGPGEKVAEALKDGDLGKAAHEMKKLVEKMKNEGLNKEEKEKLANQLEQMKNKIDQMQAKREQQKQELKDQIEQKRQAGDLAEAAKMQEKLDQMQAQDQKMQEMGKKMSDKLGQAAKALKEGGEGKQGGEKAQQAMQEMADELNEMQDQLAEAESLDEVMNEMEDAKNAMNCDKCDGQGCKACKGQGQGKGKKDGPPGRGLGEGQGEGERPEEATDTKDYKSRVRISPKRGQATRIGDAGGPNQRGTSKETAQAEVKASLEKEPESLDETALPRDQREHLKEYFDKVLKGE